MAKRKPRYLPVEIGDWVLLGQPGISMPFDWYSGRVVWIGDEELLVERFSKSNGDGWHQVEHRSRVRGAGDYGLLRQFRDHCGKEVRALQEKVTDAEHALEAARKAVWRKLDEIGAAAPVCARPQVVP